jgi:hypothetical protein
LRERKHQLAQQEDNQFGHTLLLFAELFVYDSARA